MTPLEAIAMLVTGIIIGRWSKHRIVLHESAVIVNSCPEKLAPSPDAEDYESDQASRLRELVARN